MNYTYRTYPNASQQAERLEWLEACRGVYNYALRELKDVGQRREDVTEGGDEDTSTTPIVRLNVTNGTIFQEATHAHYPTGSRPRHGSV